jgi:hypothetical protein
VVTLGHCVSAVSMVQDSEWFNDKLAKLADRKAFWLDVTAGKDAVAFYKVNPALHQSSRPDLTLSAGFHKTFSPSFYRSVKWNFYKVHFLYLFHSDHPEKSPFNFQKILFDESLFRDLQAKTVANVR